MAIQYEDSGPDTSVLAPARLTGPAPDTTGAVLGSPAPRSGDFLGDLQARSDRASSALGGLARQNLHDTSVLDQMEQGRIERDRGRMEQSFNMESAAANDPALSHPWNADKERSERIKGPLENFGSVASIFALAASAFTRTPMNSALTAAGAAMTAMHQNDEEGYKSAYEAWKANSDLAIKRFNIEHSLYEDANKLVTTDTNLWRQKRLAIAAQFDDQKRIIMLENGMDPEVLKADEALTKSAEQAIDYKKKMEDIELTRNISQQKMQQWSAEHPMPDVSDLPPEEQKKVKAQYDLAQYTAKNQAMLDAKHQVAQAGSTARGGLNPNQQQYELIRQKYAGDPDAEGKIADEYATFVRNQKVAGSGSKPGTSSDDNAKIDADIRASHPDWSNSQVISERNRQIKVSKIASSDAVLNDEEATFMAKQYMQGDKTVLQNLGRGVQGSANLIALRKKVVEIAKEEGVTPAELATRMAEFSGMMAAQRTLGTRTANVEMFNNEALNMMTIAQDKSHEIPRTQFPAINRALLAYEQQTGDPKVRAFGASINSLVNAYAKAIQGGGQATVSDKEHAREILTQADTPEQFDAVLGVLKAELEAARKAPGQVRQELRELSGGGSTLEPGKIPANTTKSPPINLLKNGTVTTFSDGSKWTLRDGKAVKVDQ